MFEKLGRKLSDHHHDQCLMPEGADILRNAMGTAPGMMMKVADKRIISMPGVPFEMKSIMEEVVLPMLAAESDTVIFHRTILTCGAGETQIENAIADIVGDFPPAIGIAYLPAIGQVRLRLTAKGNDKASLRQDLDTFTKKITYRTRDDRSLLSSRAWARRVARRVFMSARLFGAAEALALGLLARAVPAAELDAAVEAEVAPYLACAPGAVAEAKALARRLGPRIDEGVIAETIGALVRRWESPEAVEGIAAFFERRAPAWEC